MKLSSYIETEWKMGHSTLSFQPCINSMKTGYDILVLKRRQNRIRFKNKILADFPQAHEQSEGKNKILVFEQGM